MRSVSGAVCALLCCCALPAAGQTGGLSMFDCWIGNVTERTHTTHLLRCMPDLDNPAVVLDPLQAQSAILQAVHTRLHSGETAEAEHLVQTYAVLLGKTVASILLYSYPSEWSWQEQRPQRLARAILCPENLGCDVFVFTR